jgi:hypothetical protein
VVVCYYSALKISEVHEKRTQGSFGSPKRSIASIAGDPPWVSIRTFGGASTTMFRYDCTRRKESHYRTNCRQCSIITTETKSGYTCNPIKISGTVVTGVGHPLQYRINFSSTHSTASTHNGKAKPAHPMMPLCRASLPSGQDHGIRSEKISWNYRAKFIYPIFTAAPPQHLRRRVNLKIQR